MKAPPNADARDVARREIMARLDAVNLEYTEKSRALTKECRAKTHVHQAECAALGHFFINGSPFGVLGQRVCAFCGCHDPSAPAPQVMDCLASPIRLLDDETP